MCASTGNTNSWDKVAEVKGYPFPPNNHGKPCGMTIGEHGNTLFDMPFGEIMNANDGEIWLDAPAGCSIRADALRNALGKVTKQALNAWFEG